MSGRLRWDSNGHRARRLRARVIAHYTLCHLCGKRVDKTLPHTDPGAPELDHLVPVSLGGDPYAWANCALAHRLCNQRRSNRPIATERPATPGPPPDTVTSRDW